MSWRRRGLSAGLLFTSLLQILAAGSAAAAPKRIGVWLTNSPSPLYYEPRRIERAVAELADAGFNTLYPNVWSRGTTFHSSRWAPLEPEIGRAHV